MAIESKLLTGMAYTQDIGAVTGGSPITITHNLGTFDVAVQIVEKGSAGAGAAAGMLVDATVALTTTNALTVTFTNNAAANLYRITVLAVGSSVSAYGGASGGTGTTSFPGAVDDFALASPTNLGDSDSKGRTHSERHDDMEAAMEAVQGELGTDPSGSYATVKARLDGLGGAALLAVGTTAGTVAAGDDARITGAVQASTFDAQSVLAATADDTPAALVIAEQRVVGRITGGNVAALTPAQVATLIDGAASVNTVAATGSTETLGTGFSMHDCTMDQSCTFTFASPTAAHVFALRLAGAFTPSFPASVKWSGGTAPTYTTPSLYTFATVDAGTTWLGSQVGRAFS